jgi:hypothetical protein
MSVETLVRQAPLIDLPDVTTADLEHLVHDMDTAGYGSLPGFICADDLRRMRDFIQSHVQTGVGYVGFVGRQAVTGSIFADLSATPAFDTLLRRLYERGTGRAAPPDDTYQVLRCLTGAGGQAHALLFHYDSYVVTVLIPVEIPAHGQTGDLVMLRGGRRIRHSYVANLIDKILLDNAVTQALMRLLHKARLLPVVRIKMIPGNAYFFWGYRRVHANEACDPGQIRATAIYHFANPHAGSGFKAKVRSLFPR